MASITSKSRIIDTLLDSDLGWLLPNLRQDLVIWNSLNDPVFFEKFIQAKPIGFNIVCEDFAPSRLALIALGQTNFDPRNFLDTIDRQIIHTATHAVNDPTIPETKPHDLVSTALLAVGLADSFRLNGSWAGLPSLLLEKPQSIWLSPIACLFGMVESPAGLLNALIQPGVESARYKLAIHAILCNPFQPTTQLATLMGLCYGPYGDMLPPTDRLILLNELSQQYPQIAIEFCRKWLDIHPDISSHDCLEIEHSSRNFDMLTEILFESRCKEIAGEVQDLPGLLSTEIVLTQNIYARLISQSVSKQIEIQSENSLKGDVSNIFEKLTQFSGASQSYEVNSSTLARMALTLIKQGFLEEANKLLPHPDEPLPENAEVLYAIAKTAYKAGNYEHSNSSTSRIIEVLDQGSQTLEFPVWGDYLSLNNLGQLLVDLHRSAEASKVFELALQTCPNDAELLKKLAGSYHSLHQAQQEVETLRTLVDLNQEHLDYRRILAQTLAETGDWQACLNEREIIVRTIQNQSNSVPVDDLYAYAQSAIKANRPELTLTVCANLLINNPEDSQALICMGEAHLLLNEQEKGLELLTRATQIAPHLAAAWITLAEAQKKIYPAETVIETLKNASQAVPNSSHVHFSLGDFYLQNNTPTLALPDLQIALELSPDDPQILVSYGQALSLLGQNEDAGVAFSKAYGLEPDFPGLARMYAHTLLELGEIVEAISPLELLMDSKPGADPAPYLDYARCILTLRKTGSAIYPLMKVLIALNEVLQINPEHAEAKALTAEALAANGDYEMAFQAYRQALDTPLSEDTAWFERLSFGFGIVAGSIGKHDVAIAALQEAGQVNQNNPAIFMALSDAYYSANLPEDAVRSARNVLIIDGDDPDHLAWFARQVVKFFTAIKSDGTSSDALVVKELPSEALNALNKAIQLAPTRTDLLLQLGSLHACLGARDEAKVIFGSIACLDFATIDDLKSAAKYLSDTGEHSAAIECLEKGILQDQDTTEMHDPSLFISLANEYVSFHDHTSAINTLDKAIEIIPNNSSLVSRKVEILLGLGQSIEALHCIETGVKNSTDGSANTSLLFLASRINRSMGDFHGAVNYARLGESSFKKQYNRIPVSKLPFQFRTQIADSYRALAQYDLAYQFVQDEIDHDIVAPSEQREYLDYVFLQAELAMETGGQIKPAIQDVKLESSDSGFSRWMAIKAQILNKAGNYKQASQMLQFALNKLNHPDLVSEMSNWAAAYDKYLTLVSLTEAALDLGMWDEAIKCSQNINRISPGEPLTHLFLARALIFKAEYHSLCEIFEVTNHKPADNSLSSEYRDECIEHLKQAKTLLETYQGSQIQFEPGLSYDQIFRLRARAVIIYKLKDEVPDPCDVLDHRTTADDAASLISYLLHQEVHEPDGDGLTRIIKIARNHPRNPSVIVQMALALQDNNPEHALKSLVAVLQQNPLSKNPSIAFCNILLARLALIREDYPTAEAAVEAAIDFWQDEANWHSLAARIYQQGSKISDAIRHLLEASTLDPNESANFMQLGKLYFEHANEDPRMLSQACKAFESVIALEPNDVSALLSLATTQYLLNNLESAENNARSALFLAPNRAEIYQLLSEIAIKNDDFQGSYEYANKAILINPRDLKSTVVLARSLSALGKHSEALFRLDSFISTAQDPKLLQMERVNILRMMDGPRSALAELITMTDSYPNEFNVLYALSKAYLEVGETDNAVVTAEKALNVCTDKTSHNEQANLHLMIGQILRKSGQLDQSIQHSSEAIQLAPDRLEPYLELGLARKERCEYQQALQIFERATVIAPDDPRALFQAGLALKESKDYKSSETMLRRAVSVAPNDLNIRRQLAAVVALNLVHNPRSGRNYAK